jgi:hypothetical protein
MRKLIGIILCCFLFAGCSSDKNINKEAASASAGHESKAKKNPLTDSKLQSWHPLESTNEMDGTQQYSLINSGEKGTLRIRCRNHRTEFYVITDSYVVMTGVRIKFDDGEATSQYWDISDDGTALFCREPIPLIKRISKSQRFLFEFCPYQEGPRILTFNVAGLEQYLGKISEIGRWPRSRGSKE